jgi:hypothetical protein
MKGTGFQASDTTSLKLSLQKSEFKKYEPVLVKIEYVNNHKIIDSIYFDFIDHSLSTLTFKIISQYGKVYDTKLLDDMILRADKPKPRILLNPGDTICASRIMNSLFGLKDDSIHFYNCGYLEPGIYTSFAEDNISGNSLRTNKISFTVSENTQQDKLVLNLLREKHYREVFDNYPGNPFTEHVYAYYCNFEIYPLMTNNMDYELIKNSYYNFMIKYPGSFYNMNYSFISGFICKMGSSSLYYEAVLKNTDSVMPGNLLFRYVNGNKYIKEDLQKVFQDCKNISGSK